MGTTGGYTMTEFQRLKKINEDIRFKLNLMVENECLNCQGYNKDICSICYKCEHFKEKKYCSLCKRTFNMFEVKNEITENEKLRVEIAILTEKNQELEIRNQISQKFYFPKGT